MIPGVSSIVLTRKNDTGVVETAEQSRLVKYYHDRRYDEVIRYARRNPRKAKNGKEGRVSKAGHEGLRETDGRRRRSLLLFTAVLSLSLVSSRLDLV